MNAKRMLGAPGGPATNAGQLHLPRRQDPQDLLASDPLLASIVSKLSSQPSASIGRGGSSSARRSHSSGVDVQAWVVPFQLLQLKRLIASGSFGRVSSCSSLAGRPG